ncbi:MAG: serine/threonine-protein kinase [Zetaproteobacteria bacterium]|nr:serine/threonine-protein kinase [Zetaproteobacteria bacterium]
MKPQKKISHYLNEFIGPYRIIHEVGAGGLGRVYEAIEPKSGKHVALKVLHDHMTTNEKMMGVFHKELLIVSRLSHKNIVRFLDSNFSPPQCYIITDFVNGYSGFELVKKFHRVPPLVALAIGFDLLQGLDHLHLHDTVHADLSSANYLIGKDARILLTDFGLSATRFVEEYSNYVLGTPGYYSPEHITRQPLRPNSDLYCLGLIIFELITGTRLFHAKQPRQKTLLEMKRPKLHHIKFSSSRSLNQGIKKLLHACLQFSHHQRIQSCEQALKICGRILLNHGIEFARLAVLQYLNERGEDFGHLGDIQQNICLGFVEEGKVQH